MPCPYCNYFIGHQADPPCIALSRVEVSRDCSREARKSVDLAPMQGAVLICLRELGDQTEEDILTATHLGPNSVRPRLLELERLGLVARTGETKPTRSGRRAQTWTATKGDARGPG